MCLQTEFPTETTAHERPQRQQYLRSQYKGDNPIFPHALKEICGSQPKDPVARLTNLGWVCFGPTLLEEFRRRSQSHFTRTYRTSHVTNEETVDNLHRKFWDLETLGIREAADPSFTTEEKAAIDQLSETQQFKNGRYHIGIPWRKGEPTFDNNYDMALSRLKSQENSPEKGSEDHRDLQSSHSRL